MRRKSAALRLGDWKLVVHRRNGGDRVELFNLAEDPCEKRDQSETQAARVTAMRKALAAQENRDNDAVPTAQEEQE